MKKYLVLTILVTGMLLFGLGWLLRARYVSLALALAATFYVHTASALLFLFSATRIEKRCRKTVQNSTELRFNHFL